MSDTAGSPSNRRFVTTFLFLVMVGLAVGVIWLIAGQHRLFTEIASAKNDRENLTHEVQTLRSAIEKQATAVNQAISDNVSKVSDRLDQQTTGMDRALKEHIATQEKSLADSLSKVSDRLDQQTTGMDRALKEHIAAQGKFLADNVVLMSNHVDQQTAVMHRALGKVIPVVMPPEWVNQLAQLEARIKDKNGWPKNAAESQVFLDQTSSLVKNIPAWAEADYLPRLTPVRWAAISFSSLNSSSVGDSDTLLALANTMPDNGSQEIKEKLQAQADSVEEQKEQRDKEMLVKKPRSFSKTGSIRGMFRNRWMFTCS